MELFKRIAPAVMHVRSTELSHEDGRAGGEATGSAFVIDRAGYVLTNYHVVQNSVQLKLMAGGREIDAVLVGTAPAFDIALLRAERAGEVIPGLEPLELGESNKLDVGQKVLAVGNPLGLHNTLTTGIVSGLARDLPGAPAGLEEALIQTDAAINPGNSGGPLLDSAGRVVGINSMVASQGQNIAFAIPIDFVKKIVPELMSMGHVYSPDLGFFATPVTAGMAALFGLSAMPGLLVEEVSIGGPADQGGLRSGTRAVPMHDTVYVLGGDLIVGVNDRPVHSLKELTAILLGSHPGDRIRFDVVRDGGRSVVTVVLPPMRY